MPLESAFIIGGGGFLGRHLLAHLLEHGCKRCTVFDRVVPSQVAAAYADQTSVVKIVQGDIMAGDIQALGESMRGHDVVFHCASPPYVLEDRELFMRVNVDGTRRVIEACMEAGVKCLVLTSSCSVIYNGQNLRNATESTPYPDRYLDCYTETKMLQERLVVAAGSQQGQSLKTVAIRPHGIFGPSDHTVSEMLNKARAGKMTAIIGNGANIVDFTYVKNVTWGHILAAEKLLSNDGETFSGQVYHVTNDEPVHFWTFIGTVLHGMKLPAPTAHVPYLLVLAIAYLLQNVALLLNTVMSRTVWRPFLTPFKVSLAGTHHYYSCDKAKQELRYKPLVSLADGIGLTLDHYREDAAA